MATNESITTARSEAKVRLLEVEPDLARFLSEEELAAARQISVPVCRVEGGLDLGRLLEHEQAFGAMVVEGMILQRLRIAKQDAIRLLGPGDLLSAHGGAETPLLVESAYSAPAETALAILGNEVLFATHRWPRLVAGLHARQAEQAERVAAQLVLCQLPRVADRLLGILWLLSESWGRVTPSGVNLPLALTHETLGSLIGARRPTVTLALKELIDNGALVRQDRGWLLLERLDADLDQAGETVSPALLEWVATGWGDGTMGQAPTYDAREELHGAIKRMREELALSREQTSRQIEAAKRVRERIERQRTQLANE